MKNKFCFVDDVELNLFLDFGLEEQRQTELKAHLNTCIDCFIRYSISYDFKKMIHDSCRMAVAPDRLREKITQTLSAAASQPNFILIGYVKRLIFGRPLLPIGIVFSLLLIFGLALHFRPSGDTGASELVKIMIHEHNEYIESFEPERGIRSADPREIANWLAVNGDGINMPCDLGLPWFGACSENENGKNLTCLFFDQGSRRVTLFITSDNSSSLDGLKIAHIKDKSLYLGKTINDNYIVWRSDGMFCVLVGCVPEESLLKMAEKII
jgi:mycothiol system anti-sigma-R factor